MIPFEARVACRGFKSPYSLAILVIAYLTLILIITAEKAWYSRVQQARAVHSTSNLAVSAFCNRRSFGVIVMTGQKIGILYLYIHISGKFRQILRHHSRLYTRPKPLRQHSLQCHQLRRAARFRRHCSMAASQGHLRRSSSPPRRQRACQPCSKAKARCNFPDNDIASGCDR